MKNTKNINKKIIVSFVFCTLILATMIYFIVSAAVTQHAESKDPAIDILEGLAATIVVVVGGFIVLYECDLFYTVYYLLFGQKRKAKTVLVILANITLIMIFIYSYLSARYMGLRKYEIIVFILFSVYIVFKIVALFFSSDLSEQKSE